jgi:LmbE family N-acetylglucosaminyl deacetylase
MASPDHWQASQITDAAVFYSRLSKWDDEFGGLPVHTIRRQLWYPLGLHSLDEPDGGGRFVMDISDTLAVKLDAVRAYKTQFPPGKERVFRLVESQNRYFGAAAGFEAGELLISTTLLGLGDLMGALFTETPALEKPFPPLVP